MARWELAMWQAAVVVCLAAGWQPARVGPQTSQLHQLRPLAVKPRARVVVGATVESPATQSEKAAEEASVLAPARVVAEELLGSKEVRMRFAPSPTGSLHVGGARTALYNWLAARQKSGKFLIRIEDTDVARSTRESEDSMLADLEWLGLDWDEGPRVHGPCGLYRQSERGDIYTEAARDLVARGLAYPCFCSEEELEEKRQKAVEEGRQVAYDGTWRDADPEEVRERLENGEPHTIRFRAPTDRVVSIDDAIRGRVEWDVQATIGDFILVRSSGVPVYNFVVAVDDALMGISTVVRAEEHLTNTVRQLLVLEALGFAPPRYAHASLILGSDRSKLSKRHGATSCGQFKAQGFLADAMINYLALLGWNDGTDKEVYSREDLIQAFDLDRVVPSPAMFDQQKLTWLNGQHLRALPADRLASLAAPFLDAVLDAPVAESEHRLAFYTAAASLGQPKADLLTQVADVARDALGYPLIETLEQSKAKPLIDDDFALLARSIVASYDAGDAPAFLYHPNKPEDYSPADAQAQVSDWIKAIGAATDRKKKRLFLPIRLAFTGRLAGPDVPAQLETLATAFHAGVEYGDLLSFDLRMASLKNWADHHLGPDAPPAPVLSPLPKDGTSNKSSSSSGGAQSSSSDPDAPIISLADFSKLRKVYEANRPILETDQDMYDALLTAYTKLKRRQNKKKRR